MIEMFLRMIQAACVIAIILAVFDEIATRHYYRWWRKYGSDNAWRKKNNLPLNDIPREPWLGRWNFK